MKFCAPISLTTAAVSSTFTRRQCRIHSRCGLRTHQRAHGAEFKLGAHRRSLLHLLEAHIDDLELRMSDDHAIDAGIAAGFDNRKRFSSATSVRFER